MSVESNESEKCIRCNVRIFNAHNFVSNDNIDVENGSIFVPQNLLLEFDICDESWVSISINQIEGHSSVAKVSLLEKESEENIFISPLLWFNINSGADNFITKSVSDVQLSLSSLECIPTYAKAVHVSLVQSPNYSANIDYSVLLKNYFSIQRVVKKGDIIAIDSKYDLLYCTKVKDELRDVWPIIYFKVVQIEGSGSLVDVHNSKLYQTGTTKCFVPSIMVDYYDDSELKIGFLSRQLELLTQTTIPYVTILRSVAVILLSGISGSGKSYIVRCLSKLLNIHLLEVDFNRILCDTPSATETKMKLMFDKVSCYTPCIALFSNMEIMCGESNGNDSRVSDCFHRHIEDMKSEFTTIVIVETSDPEVLLNSDYGTLFRHHITISSLEEDERLNILELLLSNRYLSKDVDLNELAKKLSGFVFDDIQVFVKKALSAAYQRIFGNLEDPDNPSDSILELTGDEIYLIPSDIDLALKDMQKEHKEAIGAPSVPNVDWTDIGGLEVAKKEILETIQLPLEHKELTECGLRRSGILLYGPPGTGKTLLAKAVASQCGINFLSVKGPEVINMYVGQSEENVRNIFQTARNAAPCVVFFDEFDSIAPNRGRSGDSGGVMDRVVSQLLAEIDGIHKQNQVFVIGATNRPDLLDPALLRPGRFDRQVYVGIAEDAESRLKVLRALTRKFKLENDFDLELVESQCPPLLTGADFYNLCSSAMMLAIERCLSHNVHDSFDESFEIRVQLNDFLESIKSLKPSVSEKDLNKYREVRF